MARPLTAALGRASAFRSAFTSRSLQLRRYSSQLPQEQPSPTSAFYKTFTRPVAKCALLAVLVYQLVYYGWTRLEVNEIKDERQAEITKLRAQIRTLKAELPSFQAQVRSLRLQVEAAKARANASGGGGGSSGNGVKEAED